MNKVSKPKQKKKNIVIAVIITVVLAIIFIPFFKVCRPACGICPAEQCTHVSIWDKITKSKKYKEATEYDSATKYDWFYDFKKD